ncbi:MAG: indole-3-glycerol phosphate synthase TrpC [Algiphilus sp.]
MSDILSQILDRKAEEVRALRQRYSDCDLEELAAEGDVPRGFVAALDDRVQSGGAAVIAEIKRASPSKGLIREDFDGAWLAQRYAEGGASALSVLTDRDFFGGSAEVLQAARAACSLPVLRKDFLIDPKQVLEARAMAADCILLIAAALSQQQLRELDAVAHACGMDVLVEVHSAEELDSVLQAELRLGWLLGINNRDLKTFDTRLETTLDLLPRLDDGRSVVTESGILSAADVQRMRAAGVHRFLVGESLMRAPDPGAALQQLIA